MKARSLFIFLMLAFSVSNAQTISLDNTASPSKTRGYYKWVVFVKASDSELNSIDHVEYLLHPTFPKPQVSVFNRASKFSYTATGWGEFEIKAKVVYKNNKSQYLSYWLKLQPKTARKV